MIRMTPGQWAAFEDERRSRFRERLLGFVEQRFGQPEPDSGWRTPAEVAASAIDFADTVGATTEARIARLAVVLVGVNRQRLPQERVNELRAMLLAPGRTADERIADAAAFLGIAGMDDASPYDQAWTAVNDAFADVAPHAPAIAQADEEATGAAA